MTKKTKMANAINKLADIPAAVIDREDLPKAIIKRPDAGYVPGEIAMAIMTSRPELIRISKPRAMTAEEVGELYKVAAALLERNVELTDARDAARRMAQTSLQRLETIGELARKIELARTGNLDEEIG